MQRPAKVITYKRLVVFERVLSQARATTQKGNIVASLWQFGNISSITIRARARRNFETLISHIRLVLTIHDR